MLPSPIRALCVRIQPITWVLHVTLRFDVLGCSCEDRYGSQCEHICPTNCASVNNGTRCDDQGVCVDGCFGDFFGRQCNNPCPTNCAARANGSRCDQKGVCINGCVNDHFGTQCSNPCPTNCAPRAGESRCSNPGTCTLGCITGYTGDRCASSIEGFVSEESGTGFKSGMIASLIVNVVAIVIIVVMICLLWKKRLTSKDIVNRSISDRSGPSALNEYSIETCSVYSTLDNQREKAEPYASINFGHA
ncbi:multiple epidermal growth factor-like domains protein 10 [Dreissena polymorpha]|nr:multiple epidermal growth factor-like domains protein 10 [Dreissena polymorpha]